MRIIKDENNHERNMTEQQLKDNKYYSYTIAFDLPKDFYELVLEFANTYGVFKIPDVQVGVSLCSPHEQFNKKKGRALATARMLPVEMQIYDISIDRCTVDANGFIVFDYMKEYSLEFKIIYDKKTKQIYIDMRTNWRYMIRAIKKLLTSEEFKKHMMLQHMEQLMIGAE